MAHWKKDLEELCEKISDEISDANKKLNNNGGGMSAGDVEYIDKLTHIMKSIKTVLAMAEYDDYSEEGGSYESYARGGRGGRGGNSNRGGSYESYEGGMSNARGRGRNARRDSRGRYSSEYSRGKEEMTEQLYELMEQAPDERTRKEFEKFIEKIEM